ncbi:type VII secretion protein EccCb [Corynebacterium aquatimens]|uniref:type VII secretion protein EccCb n=2 Tax=Corynebacterium TaxID=1716 RepID=UPI002541F1AD|nr:type VII secretion protein EccCb [Corynebacterium aquatimens]
MDVTDADVAAMWPGREGTRQRLTVPIGATPEGRAVFLDIKEAAHGGAGPHGLCIGATGSGKSELLRTLVIALAATHSPDELNLVLVDFKGGATFLGCEGLPHTSAVITNLEDEAVLVERMYDALSGEMHRRQELLRKAGNYANITDYTAARLAGAAGSEGTPLDPLPALVVVVDEFSELLTQHPHFAELFVAIGRLGRSLGVHLLLASQRLEEGKLRGLDSHLSYRIGLKTFSAGESRQVLGVPDAYELPSEPGSGYLKAASPELVRFRAAYVSGPLTRRVVQHRAAEHVEVRPFTGWDASEREWEEQMLADDAETITTDPSTTVVDAVVARTRALAQHAGMQAHQVWLPPLPDRMELHELQPGGVDYGHLRIPVGIVDEPYLQRQDTQVIDLGASGGHLAIAGGPQTGKSEALKTLVASLALTHTTDQVAVYAIDAGSGGLHELETLPHVAGVAVRADEERVRRVVDEVVGLIDDAAAATPAPQTSAPRRETLLIVDGWHALLASDSKLEDLRDPLTRVASEGPAAGVHLVLTTQRWSAVRTGVRDLVATRLELGLTEPLDSLIDRTAQTNLPARPGIGLTPEAKVMLFARTSAQDLAHVARVTAQQPRVPALKVLPAHVTVQDLLERELDGPAIPIGVGGPRLEPIACASGHLLAIGATGAGKSTVIACAIEAIGAMPREEARMVILDPRRAHLGRANEDMVAFYAASASAIADAVRALCTTLTARLPGADISAKQLAERSWWKGPELYLVIDDIDLVGDPVLRDVEALIPHARDIGLHVICARKFGGVSRALYGGFLGALKDLLPDVLLLDGTREEGALFGVRPSAQPPGRATLVQAGDVVGTVQLAAPYEEGASL